MPCIPFNQNGARGFMCTGPAKRCACGSRATLLCDWKTPQGKKPTCDRPICVRCAYTPAPEKHLCPQHTAEWKARAR